MNKTVMHEKKHAMFWVFCVYEEKITYPAIQRDILNKTMITVVVTYVQTKLWSCLIQSWQKTGATYLYNRAARTKKRQQKKQQLIMKTCTMQYERLTI